VPSLTFVFGGSVWKWAQ